mmetsp:Transcript_3890/g.14102  ORF Transcript_3890/g.14102 Transcript_3890/m.14102 type:complete len:346 (-) Transcript_3890:1917-2954(-)
MAHLCDVFCGAAVLHSQHALAEKLTRVRAHDVRAKNFIRRLFNDKLHHTLRVVIRTRARIRHEGKLTNHVFHTARLDFGFGLARPRDFGVGVNDGWNRVVIHVTDVTGEGVDARDAFLFRLVREHRAGDDVTDRVHARDVRGKVVVVDDDLTILGHLDAERFEAETFGERLATGGDEYDVRIHRRRLATCGRFEGQRHPTLRLLHRARHLGFQLKIKALLFQRTLKRRANFVVNRGTANFIGKLHDGNLGAQAAPHAPELQANDTTTNNNHGFGHLFQIQRARGRHDGFFVGGHARQRRRHAPSGQDHILRLNHVTRTIFAGDFNLVCGEKLPPTSRIRDFILLE